MKTSALLFSLLLITGTLTAAETRTEITKATTPEQDARPNSPSVPDVYAIEGKFERVVVLRFKYQADLLEGLQRMVKEKGIRNGVILAAVGSVTGYNIHSVSNRTFPSKNMFVKDPEAAADIISMNGYVMDGQIHPHLTLSNDKHAFGGHLEPGTTVFTFAIITIGVFADGIDLKRLDDKTYR
jgi:predicted DNA-binding protein with PD1-like motif